MLDDGDPDPERVLVSDAVKLRVSVFRDRVTVIDALSDRVPTLLDTVSVAVVVTDPLMEALPVFESDCVLLTVAVIDDVEDPSDQV